MIEREKGTHNVIFYCDGCIEYFESETEDFSEAIEKLKAEKWMITKDEQDDIWEHFCPECAAEDN